MLEDRLVATLTSAAPKYPGNCLSFRLNIANTSSERLATALPDITFLKFTDSEGTVRQWYTHVLVSMSGGGLVLGPTSSRDFELDARFQDAEVELPDDGSWFYQWAVDLPAGEYAVRYSQTIDENYFDPDSHWRIDTLRRFAEENDAKLWTGALESNAVTVYRTE